VTAFRPISELAHSGSYDSYIRLLQTVSENSSIFSTEALSDSIEFIGAIEIRAQVQIAAATLRVTVLGKLLTPIVPLFTKQHNW